MKTTTDINREKLIQDLQYYCKKSNIPEYLIALLFAIEFNIIWLIVVFSIMILISFGVNVKMNLDKNNKNN